MSASSDRATRVVAVVGPTASGKTSLAESLALALGGEIVSADSMQVYRGMDIGTAKPPAGERRVPYHCLDLVDPGEPYSAARFQLDARAAIDDIAARGRVPIVAGGTGLYVRAALDDMTFPGGEIGSAVRRAIELDAGRLGGQGLHDELARRDPASAALIHPNNVRRTVRALELAEQGISYAERAGRFRHRCFVRPTVMIGLVMDRDALYPRIDERVDEMMRAGLLDEVSRLLEAGYRSALTASQAIGYKELVRVVEEGADIDSAVADIKRATRHYAKRQSTWFRADARVLWLDVTGSESARVTDDALRLVESFEREEGGHGEEGGHARPRPTEGM